MAFFPGLRGLTGKQLPAETETKVVYTSTGIVDASRAGVFSGSSRPQGGEWTIDRALNEAYKREPYAFKAVETIAEKSSSLEFKLKDGEDIVEDHSLYTVLNHGKANPLETGRQFRKRLSMQVLLNPQRGAFVNIVKTKGGDVSTLALLPPDRTFPIPNEDDPSKLIKGFLVKPKDGTSKPQILSVEEVRWVRNPHPLDPFSATSPLDAAGTSILLSYFARLFNLSFMRNDGRPGGILGVEGDMTDDDMDRIEQKFGRGPMESGKLTVVAGKAVYTDTGQAPRDMQYQELAANAAKEIAVAFGVPESVMGHASGATFANAEAEAYSFWINTMVPHNDMIVSAFNEDSSEQLTGFLDTSEIEELQEPIRRRREEARQEWEAGLRTLKSYGELAGIDVPDMPETRAYYIKQGVTAIPGDEADRDFFKQQQVGPGGGGEELADPTGEAGSTDSGGGNYAPGSYNSPAGSSPSNDGQEGATGSVASRRVTPRQSVAATSPTPEKPAQDAPQARSGTSVEPTQEKQLEGKASAGDESATSESPVALLDKTEEALNAAADRVVARQASVVVTRLRGPKFRRGTKHWVADESKPVDSRVDVKALNADAVVQGDKWADELVTDLTPIVTDAAQAAAESIIDDLSLNDVEVKARHRRITDKQAKVIADTATEALFVAKSAMKKHGEALAARIKEADEAGKDLDAIIADVEAYALQYRRGWSRTVMQQVGQVAIEQTRLRVSDLSKKQRDIQRVWVSRKDAKVRPAHKAANGDRKRLGEPFKVGGSSLRYPGDPLGKPEDTINCRCRLTYTAKSTGRFVATPTGERKALALVWSTSA